jgi:hypothetical protein
MRAGAASLLAALAVVAAGCGGGGGGGANALPAAADVVPASAPVLISINTNFASPQWKNALALVPKFPSLSGLLRRGGRETGIDFERDVKPALGPEVDVVFLDFANDGNDVVGLTQPKNKAKLVAALKKLDAADDSGTTYTEDVNGWTVIADARSKIDSFRRASSGDKLADVGTFKDAVSRLDAKAGVRAYVAGEAVQRELDRGLAREGAPPALTRDDLARLESISAAAWVERDGVRVETALATDPAANPKTYTPALPKSLPAGALLYISTANLADPARTIDELVARSNPTYETQKSRVETVVGLTLEGDVFPLISREQAIAVYPAKRIPKVVFVTKVPDEERAKRLVDRLLSLAKLGGLDVTTFRVGGTTVSDLTQPGSSVHGFVAVTAGKLIIGSARDTLARLIQGKGRKLSDDPLYREARAKAHPPGKVVAMVYGDLAHGLPFAFDLAEASGDTVPPEARQNTRPLKEALLYATQDGNRFRLSGFLTIK